MVKLSQKETQFLVNKYGSPLIVYDEDLILKRINLVREAFRYKNIKILYALKANSNISILRIFKRAKCKIDASSPGDVFLALEAGFNHKDIYATGPNWTNKDLKYFIDKKILLDMDSVSLIRRYGHLNTSSKIGIRINPGVGCGFHKDVYAGGDESKLGIILENLSKAREEAKKNNLKIIGLHFHVGSSCFQLDPFIKALGILLKSAEDFPYLEYINIGGGYGVNFKKNQKDFDIKKYGHDVIELLENFNKNKNRGNDLELRIEIGEFLMWPCACAIGLVNTIKQNKNKKFVGVDLNSNHIPTPLLYDEYHEIETFSKRKKEIVNIAGNLCLTGDLLAKQREINGVVEGDLIIIQTVGAYCTSRSSNFNSRLRPVEILRSKNNRFSVIRKETLKYLLQGQIYEKR